MSDNERMNKARRGIFAVLADAGIISRDDRLELAGDILNRSVDSFSDLSEDDLLDLHFALQSWKRIQNVRSANGALLKESELVVEEVHDVDLSALPKRTAPDLPFQDDEEIDDRRY